MGRVGWRGSCGPRALAFVSAQKMNNLTGCGYVKHLRMALRLNPYRGSTSDRGLCKRWKANSWDLP